jgi:hypothetical protein
MMENGGLHGEEIESLNGRLQTRPSIRLRQNYFHPYNMFD